MAACTGPCQHARMDHRGPCQHAIHAIHASMLYMHPYGVHAAHRMHPVGRAAAIQYTGGVSYPCCTHVPCYGWGILSLLHARPLLRVGHPIPAARTSPATGGASWYPRYPTRAIPYPSASLGQQLVGQQDSAAARGHGAAATARAAVPSRCACRLVRVAAGAARTSRTPLLSLGTARSGWCARVADAAQHADRLDRTGWTGPAGVCQHPSNSRRTGRGTRRGAQPRLLDC
jgi:hypothetical protein